MSGALRKPGELIDIDLSESCERVVEGAFITQSEQIFVLLTFERGRFDGIAAYRNKEVKRWRNWSRKEVHRIKTDGRLRWLAKYPMEGVGSFCTFLRAMLSEPVGLCLYGEEGFWVGTPVKVDRLKVRMRLVNQDADRVWVRSFPLNRIEWIEFTPYTRRFKKILAAHED